MIKTPSNNKGRKYVSLFPYNLRANLKNLIFDPRRNKRVDATIFATLREYLKQNNISINTCDISVKGEIYRYVYFDIPYPFPSNFFIWKLIFSNRKKNILIANEPPIVVPFNYIKIFSYFFTKIYTWNDNLVDNKKYFKIHLPQYSLGFNVKLKKFNDKKFIILINSNKLPFFPFRFLSSFGIELYSGRIKAIEFFELNIPDRFDLYGRGWNKPKKNNLTEQIFGYKKYSTYKGEIDDKWELLSNYKYCLCFENLANVKGYITEKIFDCFKAKCIPIYWGAPNIGKYIRKNCFIDFSDFGYDYQKLLDYLDSIDETRYNRYIKNIESLLADKKFINQWFEKGFAKFFLNDILEIQTSFR